MASDKVVLDEEIANYVSIEEFTNYVSFQGPTDGVPVRIWHLGKRGKRYRVTVTEIPPEPLQDVVKAHT